MNYYLGVDVGGTKTHALIADESGRAVGFAQAGTGSWEVVGYNGLEMVFNGCRSSRSRNGWYPIR